MTTVEANVEVSEHSENVCDNFDELYSSLSEKLSETYTTLRLLRTSLKQLEKLHYKELKSVKRHKKPNNHNMANKKPSGFNKPGPVPLSITTLLGLAPEVELPRTKVTKLMYQYIKDNQLQDPTDKRTIVPNNELKTLFNLGTSDQVSFYNIQTHIKTLYPAKLDETVAPVLAAPVLVDAVPDTVVAVDSTEKKKGGRKPKVATV